MEIILKQDMINLGYKDDIVKVKDGYANNFLIPKGFAIMATPSNRKILAENIRQRESKLEAIRNQALAIIESYSQIEDLKIKVKASDNGKIYGSVGNIQVADAVKEQFGIEIDKKKLQIVGGIIKTLGTFKAVISEYRDIKKEITFEVIAE